MNDGIKSTYEGFILKKFEARAYVAQDSFTLVLITGTILELLDLLPQLSSFWDCRCGLPYPAGQLILRMGRICAMQLSKYSLF